MVNESKKFERERKTILNRALIDIENSGFNEKMLLNAAKNCKISRKTFRAINFCRTEMLSI